MALKLQDINNFHIIGIGGSGLMPIAECLAEIGKSVKGSDVSEFPLMNRLITEGIKVIIGHSRENISSETELIIYSAAIPPSNPELIRGRELGIQAVKYSEFLSVLTEGKYLIGVAGTHGKTTTSGLLSHIFQSANKEPSFLIGGEVPSLNKSARITDGPNFFIEACEYDRTFLNLNPNCILLTNIELDHLDYYGDEEEILDAFNAFINKLPDNAPLIINNNSPLSFKISQNIKNKKIISVGDDNANFTFKEKHIDQNGMEFELTLPSGQKVDIKSQIKGQHNIYNISQAYACSSELGLSSKEIQEGITSFKGIKRRMELLNKFSDNCLLFDDYGHHPTELNAVITTLRQTYPEHKILLIFQPHQYSRTHFLMDDFVQVLSLPDEVIITDIYPAREAPAKRDINLLWELVNKTNRNSDSNNKCSALLSKEEIIKIIKRKYNDKSIILTMGAGDIWKTTNYINLNI